MKPTVSVIGTIFVDMKGMAFGPVKKDARNLGKVLRSHGGSARNAAENLRQMGLECVFVSTVNNDELGGEVVNKLQTIGVRTEFMQACPNGMGIWLAVIDNQGTLISSISQLPDLQKLEDLILSRIEEIAKTSNGIAMDVDLTYKIATRVIEICQKYNIPLYGVVGNLDIVSHHPQILSGYDCFVCNKEEAEILLGEKIKDVNEAKAAVLKLAMRGSKAVVITLDVDGSVYYDSKTKEHGHCPTQNVTLIDCTGAGDAFFSGLVYELVQGRGIKYAVQTGTQVALQVIQSSENNLTEYFNITEMENNLA